MKLRFFFIESNTVQRAAQSRVLAAWERRKPWDQSTGTQDLKLITAVCDDNLHPVHVYLLKLSLEDGWISEQSRQNSVKLIIAQERWGGGNKKQRAAWIAELRQHVQDMPPDWGNQLAAALDVPVYELVNANHTVGGPLPVSLQMDISVQELLLYYDPVKAG
jgi:hypothetical protein